MYNRSESPQVRYSLESLTKSFFYFMQTQKMDEISITQICEKAGLARRTFYRNCENRQDLILYACDRLIEELQETVDFSSEDARQLYMNFFSYWGRHKLFLRCLKENDLYGLLVERFVRISSEGMRFPLQENALGELVDPEQARFYCNSFLLGGLTRMLYAWAEDEFHADEKALTESILFLAPVQQKSWDGIPEKTLNGA